MTDCFGDHGDEDEGERGDDQNGVNGVDDDYDHGPADGDGSDPSANVPSGTTGEIVDTLI